MTTQSVASVMLSTHVQSLGQFSLVSYHRYLWLRMTRLSSLDLSFNLLRQVPDSLSYFQQLHTVYFIQNKITKISGLNNLGNTLRSLELGGNRLRVRASLELPKRAMLIVMCSICVENWRSRCLGQPRRALVREEQDYQTRGTIYILFLLRCRCL